VLREHRPTKRVYLNLPLDCKTRALEAQIEPADPGEQAPNRESWGISHV